MSIVGTFTYWNHGILKFDRVHDYNICRCSYKFLLRTIMFRIDRRITRLLLPLRSRKCRPISKTPHPRSGEGTRFNYVRGRNTLYLLRKRVHYPLSGFGFSYSTIRVMNSNNTSKRGTNIMLSISTVLPI